MKLSAQIPLWTIVAPLFAMAILLAAVLGVASGGIFVVVITLALAASVFAAVHHAERVAHRIGEPYGTLVLALAVTLIEVALIVSLMIAGADAANRAHDHLPRRRAAGDFCRLSIYDRGAVIHNASSHQLRAATSSICLSRSAGSS
jgi:type VI protein secretion system component VasK